MAECERFRIKAVEIISIVFPRTQDLNDRLVERKALFKRRFRFAYAGHRCRREGSG